MSKIERFEDIVAWQKARILAKAIYQVTSEERFARDYGLSGQIQRAAVSIMSNIAAGYERDSPNEFHRFLIIAKASCDEVRSQLYVALDMGYIDQTTFRILMRQADEVGRIIGSFRNSIRRK